MDVDNFGEYWDKGTLDPYLTGEWALARNKDEVRITVSSDKQVYHIEYNTQERYIAKTLKMGNYTFMMLKETKYKDKISGVLVRYAIKDHNIVVYEFDHAALAEFLKNKYPETEVFYSTPGKGSDITMRLFNDETFKILSDIPDTDRYWHISDVYVPAS